jgi:hypothetical protein
MAWRSSGGAQGSGWAGMMRQTRAGHGSTIVERMEWGTAGADPMIAASMA